MLFVLAKGSSFSTSTSTDPTVLTVGRWVMGDGDTYPPTSFESLSLYDCLGEAA